ncbi:MAG: 1-acyl-sn-glycerol-3-phosphate acyltransferase [Actinomycetota bacterium]|nr:1-acyl-sn-glycerol-3-phosphate acyltransferase [Actinomycetota bacterium]
MARDGVREVTSGERFRAGVQTLSQELDRSVEDVQQQAAAAIAEMSACHTAGPTWAWRRLGQHLLRNYDLRIDERTLRQLRELDHDHTIVWLPSHRSYLDTWAAPTALHLMNFPPFYVMGGINLDFWPFGDLARRTGMVFIRRSIRDDPVYRFALREYLAHLVSQHADIGWAIEGGRSRTGKMRPPQYGLLRYLTDAVRESGADDVLLAPMSIVYDQLPEVQDMAAEARGAGKRPEDIRWLAEFMLRQRRGGGGIHIDFADPVSLSDRLAELDTEQDGRGHQVERVALDVCHRINRVTPIVPAAAVTIALLAADRALTLEQLVQAVKPLNRYFERRGFAIASSGRLDHPALVLRTLDSLVRAGATIRFDAGREPVWGIGPEQHLVAAFYRNSALHFLVERAVAELARERGRASEDDQQEAAWREALRLRELLKFEFFFASKDEFLANIRTELEILDEDPEWLPLAPLALRPFLESYLVLADCLTAMSPGHQLHEQAFLEQCLGVGQQWLLQRRLTSAESVSLELFKTGLALARHRDLEGPGDADLDRARRAFARELGDTLDLVAAVQSRVGGSPRRRTDAAAVDGAPQPASAEQALYDVSR